MAALSPYPEGHALIPAGDGWFDQLARISARDVSRRTTLKLAAGLTATSIAASWLRPGPARAKALAGDSGCAGTRSAYSSGCAKPVPKQNYTPSFNGCGPENGFVAVPQRPLNVATFTKACNAHDVCYGTCNRSKSKCDSDFFKDMAAICASDYPTSGILNVLGRGVCLQLAATYANAVTLGGGSAFATGQSEGCDCCTQCPGSQTPCGDKCCAAGYECSNGACCSSCGNYIKCSTPAAPGSCDFGCCNPTTICCPNAKGIPRCCPANLCCAGVCTTC
jgi:hypothetical protein